MIITNNLQKHQIHLLMLWTQTKELTYFQILMSSLSFLISYLLQLITQLLFQAHQYILFFFYYKLHSLFYFKHVLNVCQAINIQVSIIMYLHLITHTNMFILLLKACQLVDEYLPLLIVFCSFSYHHRSSSNCWSKPLWKNNKVSLSNCFGLIWNNWFCNEKSIPRLYVYIVQGNNSNFERVLKCSLF